MTDTNRSLNEVPALIDERRTIRGLARRARRSARHDAAARLRARQSRLSGPPRSASTSSSRRIATSIDEERASVQSRLSLLEAEEQLRRDERAELELRAHVGELAGDEADSGVQAPWTTRSSSSSARSTDSSADRRARGAAGAALRRRRRRDASGKTVSADVRAAERAARAAVEQPPRRRAAVGRAPRRDGRTRRRRPRRRGGSSAAPSIRDGRCRPSAAAGTPRSFDELAFLNAVVGQDGGRSEPPVGRTSRRRWRGAVVAVNDACASRCVAGLAAVAASVEPARPSARSRRTCRRITPIVLRTRRDDRAAEDAQVQRVRRDELSDGVVL